jgi:Predicted transcriptional regulators
MIFLFCTKKYKEKEELMKNRIAGYRRMLGYTQASMAKEFGISKQSWFLKEKGKIAFSDDEKIKFQRMLKDIFPTITIDEIFFN